MASRWMAITPDGRYVYTSNAGSGNVSGFSVNGSGALSPLPGTIVGSNASGSTNLDITISGGGKFLYTINSGTGTVGIFAINSDGTLRAINPVTGLRAMSGYNGIAAL